MMKTMCNRMSRHCNGCSLQCIDLRKFPLSRCSTRFFRYLKFYLLFHVEYLLFVHELWTQGKMVELNTYKSLQMGSVTSSPSSASLGTS